jgi:putative oxidoreductase
MSLHEGLLIGRLAFGLIMAAHGAQKLFGWFGGYGIAGTGAFFESIGFRPGRLLATAAGFSELVGGVLIALGLFGPVGPALMLSVMIVAIAVHAGGGLFAQSNGIELPLLYAVAALSFALIGPGAYSLDAALGLARLWTPAVTGVVLAIGVLGGLANVTRRRPVAAPAQA